MPQLPIISAKIAIKAFAEVGYQVARQKGSHIRLCHNSKRPLTIPNHKIIGKGLLRKLLRDAELSVDEFISLLNK